MATPTISTILTRLQTDPIKRSFSIGRAAVNEKDRTVNVAFASDQPIEHYFGKLILTVNAQAMRSDRLRSGAAVLVEHDRADQVGVVEGFSISGGKARADIRFSRSARGEEVFRDVLDGIRQNVSVGFMIHDLKLESEAPGEMPVYRSDDWEAFEISIVSVPADISVGVGRSQNHQQKENKKMNNEQINDAGSATSLIAFASIFGEADLARRLILADPSTTQEDIRRAIATKMDARPAALPIPVRDPVEQAYAYGAPYEPARTIPRYGKLEGFKGPDAERRAHRFGQFLLAGPFGNRAAQQWCQTNGLALSRAAQYGGLNEKGGYLVPDEFGNDIVDLVEKYGVFRQHAKIVPMNSDRRTDPVIAGELESQFVGELEEGDDQDLDFGMIGLTAKKHMILVPMSSEISEDAAISIADTVATAAARAFAKKEDSCGFNGDATSPFGGITGVRAALKEVDGTIGNIAGLQVATGNNYAEITLGDFEKVAGRLPDYADMGAKWFVSRKFFWTVMMRCLLGDTVGLGATAEEISQARAKKFLGYDVVFTHVMPTTEANSQVCALFGDLSLGARFGDRRFVTIALDDSILFRKDALLLRATSRFDINVHGVGDTTEAGPIVGLITAAA